MESIRKVKERGEKLRKGVADRLRKERRPDDISGSSFSNLSVSSPSLLPSTTASSTSSSPNLSTARGSSCESFSLDADSVNLSSPSIFEENFWGENGIRALKARTSAGRQFLKAFEHFLHDRLQVEESFVKCLTKSSRSFRSPSTLGSTSQVWQNIEEETEALGSHHSKFCNRLRELVADVHRLKERYSKAEDALFSEITRANKELTNAQNKRQACFARYEAMTREVHTARQAMKNAQSSGKAASSIGKRSAKVDKVYSLWKAAEHEYQAAVEKETTLLTHPSVGWEARLRTCYRKLQEIEEDRIRSFASIFAAFCDAQLGSLPDQSQAFDRMKQTLGSVDVEGDIVDFVQRYGTGSHRPPPPQVTLPFPFPFPFPSTCIVRFVGCFLWVLAPTRVSLWCKCLLQRVIVFWDFACWFS